MIKPITTQTAEEWMAARLWYTVKGCKKAGIPWQWFSEPQRWSTFGEFRRQTRLRLMFGRRK